MSGMATYIHVLEGRLRVKVPEVKRSQAHAEELKRRLDSIPGIEGASVNPNTGSVLIHYDREETSPLRILDSLHSMGYLKAIGPRKLLGLGAVGRGVALGITELAFQRLFTALIL